MAAALDVSGLTLNPQEQTEFAKFVFERVFNLSPLSTNHAVWEGVKMKEQIVFASQLGKSGIKDAGTSRPNSGSKPVLTQKYWEPAKVGDTMVFQNAELNSLFKAYFSKIQKYEDIFVIDGTDEQKFLAEVIVNSAIAAVYRYVWLGDKSVIEATALLPGLKLAADLKFYDAIDGLWTKIFAEVTAGKMKRHTIAKNALLTFAAQKLAAKDATAVFEAMWLLADPRLKADPNAIFFVTNTLWENYRQELQAVGTPYDISYTTDGFSELKWNGKVVRNMELVWDLPLKADFAQLSTALADEKPHRALLTVIDNIPVATLNSGDLDTIEVFYDQIKRENYMAYGFTLDAQILEGYMAVAAY